MVEVVLLADAMDGQNVGWYAFAIVVIPVLVKFIWDAVDRFGANRKTTIGEWQDLFNQANKTLEDVRREMAIKQEEYDDSIRKVETRENECQRQVTELRVKMRWVESEFRREGKRPPWDPPECPVPPSRNAAHEGADL